MVRYLAVVAWATLVLTACGTQSGVATAPSGSPRSSAGPSVSPTSPLTAASPSAPIDSPSSLPSPTIALPFSDDFSTDSNAWTTVGDGTWSIVEQRYVVNMGQGGSLSGVSSAGDPNWTDYAFQVDVKGEEGIDKIVLGHFFDNNAYGVNIRSAPYNDINLTKAVGGVVTILSSVPFQNANGVTYRIRMVFQGTTILVYVNNVLIISYMDQDHPLTHGEIALFGFSTGAGAVVSFGNVLVTSVSASVSA